MAALAVALLSLATQLADVAAAARGKVGFAAELIETGARIGLADDAHYPMQSVYKLPIAMAVLHAGHRLDESVTVAAADLVPNMHSPLREQHPQGVTLTVGELVRFAIVESDGTASDVLLRLAGGAPAVERYLRQLGIHDIAVATTERAMGDDERAQYRNWCTPRAALAVLRAAQTYPVLIDRMAQSRPGPKRIKGRLPPGTVVAHKTGTSGTVGGLSAATNDIGLVTLPDGRHLAIAVFVSDARADEATREDVIARLARVAWDWATR
ncbi:MAG: Beta-lactamase [bacterium]|nr:Beta-lactamase [bacterium]